LTINLIPESIIQNYSYPALSAQNPNALILFDERRPRQLFCSGLLGTVRRADT
jgi:hypothetical protein